MLSRTEPDAAAQAAGERPRWVAEMGTVASLFDCKAQERLELFEPPALVDLTLPAKLTRWLVASQDNAEGTR